MRFFPLLVFSLFPTLIEAGTRPVLPTPGEDLVLTNGQTPTQFFRARAAKEACRTDLERLKKNYLATGTGHDELLQRLEECGDCATREVRSDTVFEGGHTEEWYVSDGSCQIEGDPGTLRNAYRRIKSSLLHLKRYPQKFGGFPNVLEFVAVDPLRGTVLRGVDEVTKPPVYSFLSVMGKDPTGLTVPAFSYFIRNQWKEEEIEGGKQFAFTYKNAKRPRGFQSPDVYFLEKNGDKSWAIQFDLPAVHGMWYLAFHEGERLYLRYHTAADFMMKIPYATSFAREVLMETLFLLTQRAYGVEAR